MVEKTGGSLVTKTATPADDWMFAASVFIWDFGLTTKGRINLASHVGAEG